MPYNGTTTTCEALWMGVPVVTLIGNTHAGRVGASLLKHAGLGEFAATTRDEYRRTAAGLARDAQRLAALRRELRPRLRSTIANPAVFLPRFESALDAIWAGR
jgi:predicted O-linked N-acetylglucosamine transferase (SPINDLY family)